MPVAVEVVGIVLSSLKASVSGCWRYFGAICYLFVYLNLQKRSLCFELAGQGHIPGQ